MSRPANAEVPGAIPPAPPSPAGLADVLRAVAAVMVAGAVAWSEGLYDPFALALVTAAAALVGAAAWARGVPGPLGSRALPLLLGAAVAGGLLFDALFLPGVVVEPARLGGFRPALAVLAAAAATHLWPRAPRLVEALRFPIVVLAWLVLAGIVLHAAPEPGIDVWRLQQAAALALAEGRNPYAVAYPNPYGPETTLIARELLSPDGWFVTAFPYPPATLLPGVPAALAGDVRWLFVVSTGVAAGLAFLLGRRSRVAELAATFLLVQPRTLFVMELSWTEPFVLAAVVATAWWRGREEPAPSAAARGWWVLGLLAGVALASKQYALLVLLPFVPLVPSEARWRVAAGAAVVLGVLHLPFLAWDPAGLWRGLVRYQLAQPFRPDALSWPAAVVAWGGRPPPGWPAFLLAFAAAWFAGRRVRSVADALAAGTLAWLVLVAGSKQAFANYYWLAAGLLCAAVAAASAGRGDRASATGDRA